jgi:homoserine kinase
MPKSNSSSCEAIAPSSSANIGPGFDVFGLALDLFYDKVKLRKLDSHSSSITTRFSNNIDIPTSTEQNSASLAIRSMVHNYAITNDIEITITKKVPHGYGLGSSASSAVASVCAFNHLFNLGIDKQELVEFAAEGEIASSGTKHYDNVAASLFGGFVIVRTRPILEVISIEPPSELVMIVGIPNVKVPSKKTALARSILPKRVSLKKVTHNIFNSSTVVSGFLLKDPKMIGKGINDEIVEPVRKQMISGYDIVKKNSLEAGALATTISGAGPSIISFSDDPNIARNIAKSMKSGFLEAGIRSAIHICNSSKGASII